MIPVGHPNIGDASSAAARIRRLRRVLRAETLQVEMEADALWLCVAATPQICNFGATANYSRPPSARRGITSSSAAPTTSQRGGRSSPADAIEQQCRGRLSTRRRINRRDG